MYRLNFNRHNRNNRRRREKIKQKVIISLIGKEKTDRRTFKNLKKFFKFVANKKEFTGSQLVKKGMPASIVYELLEKLKQKQLIIKIGEKKSSGRGKTDIFSFTLAGEIIAACMNDDIQLFFQALNKMIEKEPNPIKRFCLQAFMQNYPTELMQKILEDSIRKAEVLEDERGLDIDELASELIQNSFIVIPFLKEDEETQQIFRNNIELMQKSEYKELLFLYFKFQIESLMLFSLKGEKLKKYAESLKEKPELFHYPCDNPNCNNVIIIESLLDLVSRPIYCEQCSKQIKKGELALS